MHRLFLAIRPPEEIRDLLIDVMDDGADFHWQSDEQLHLTLRFIGEVERPLATDIAHSMAGLRSPPFELRLSGLGTFDHRSGGAIWAGVEPAEPVKALAARVERICQSAGLAPERRAFRPHITLARWKGPRSHEARAFLDGRHLASEPFAVDHVILYESRLSRHGAHYEAVEQFELV
jgi:2'-5' RNA ligase